MGFELSGGLDSGLRTLTALTPSLNMPNWTTCRISGILVRIMAERQSHRVFQSSERMVAYGFKLCFQGFHWCVHTGLLNSNTSLTRGTRNKSTLKTPKESCIVNTPFRDASTCRTPPGQFQQHKPARNSMNSYEPPSKHRNTAMHVST